MLLHCYLGMIHQLFADPWVCRGHGHVFPQDPWSMPTGQRCYSRPWGHGFSTASSLLGSATHINIYLCLLATINISQNTPPLESICAAAAPLNGGKGYPVPAFEVAQARRDVGRCPPPTYADSTTPLPCTSQVMRTPSTCMRPPPTHTQTTYALQWYVRPGAPQWYVRPEPPCAGGMLPLGPALPTPRRRAVGRGGECREKV